MMMAQYRVKDWNTLFENNRTRELKRLDWVPVPNKMDGRGYTALMDHPNGIAHFGAWVVILEIASRQKIRGEIPHDGAGLSQGTAGLSQCLARISRAPFQIFEEVLPRLISMGWIETAEIPQEGATFPQEGAASRARIPFSSIPFNSVPDSAESEIRLIADACPDQQDYEAGIDLAMQSLLSSANPKTTLQIMRDNLPLWWAAMRDGRARVKPLRYVIKDKDYLRVPKPVAAKEKPARRPNYRLGEGIDE